MVVTRAVSPADWDTQAPEGRTEWVVPRKGNRKPVRYVRDVSVAFDYEQVGIEEERDPLTKRGWRRVVLIRTHPKYTGVYGALRLAQREIMEGLLTSADEWGRLAD